MHSRSFLKPSLPISSTGPPKLLTLCSHSPMDTYLPIDACLPVGAVSPRDLYPCRCWSPHSPCIPPDSPLSPIRRSQPYIHAPAVCPALASLTLLSFSPPAPILHQKGPGMELAKVEPSDR